jgi:broad specificity phosphatase PhoE
MKQIYVLRHADKNPETGELTDEGRQRARELRQQLGAFDRVITSNRPRLTETAELLTGVTPEIDERAGFMYSAEEENERLGMLAKSHPLSHAGVLSDRPEFEELEVSLGKNLMALLKDVLKSLPENGKALVLSQDGVMVAAERALNNKPRAKLEKSFLPLEGFVVDEALRVRGI